MTVRARHGVVADLASSSRAHTLVGQMIESTSKQALDLPRSDRFAVFRDPGR